MLNLTVIILTKDESLHIKRCIENVKPISKRILVIDSHSTDGTQKIAESLGAEVIEHDWPGNQADQFNWALDNLLIDTEWVLRLDADEYLTPELLEELNSRLSQINNDINGIVFKRRHIFLNKWMKHGIYPVKILRLFRTGHARYENRLMDEHLLLNDGGTIEFENDFCDHNLNDLSWFCKKHVDYSIKEAAEILNKELKLSEKNFSNTKLAKESAGTRSRKEKYSRQPLFWRAFAYFLYRYFFRGGWKDGKEGFIFNFIQGWWYRTLVDSKLFEIRKQCGNDKEKIINHLKSKYSIEI